MELVQSYLISDVHVFIYSLLGVHSNMCFTNSLSANLKVLLGSLWPTLIVDEAHVDKVYPFGQHFAYLLEEMGYMHLQATKPDTLGKSGKCRIYLYLNI